MAAGTKNRETSQVMEIRTLANLARSSERATADAAAPGSPPNTACVWEGGGEEQRLSAPSPALTLAPAPNLRVLVERVEGAIWNGEESCYEVQGELYP